MKSSPKLLVWLALALSSIGTPFVAADEEFVEEEELQKITAVFVNEHPREQIELFWVNPDLSEDDPGRFIHEANIAPRGGSHHSETFESHEFAYEYNGEMHYIIIDRPNAHDEQVVVVGGAGEGIRVRCEISLESGKSSGYLDILVQSYWAPRGAIRFLELVRMGYYDGVVFNRVVPKFLIQFGIAKDYETRTEVRDVAIWDDYDPAIAFEPGFVSYAGTGPDSRTAEIFIVMPGASQEQLARFGKNDWETPFGFVEGNLQNLSKIYSGYGDMPPWGKGPDSQLIYAKDGYTTYLPKNFPLLDSIQTCYIVDEVGLYSAEEL
ncbi:hypothetical protein ACHAW6_002286 [Cyclotella cf. meneghiniana]